MVCKDIYNIKKCTVSKSHFENKVDGYYYIHHKNNVNKYSVNYESFGVKVILHDNDSDDSDEKNTGEIYKYSLNFISLLFFLVL